MKEYCESFITRKGDDKVTVLSNTSEHIIQLIVDGNDTEFVDMNKKEAEKLIELLRNAIKKVNNN